MDLNFSFKIWCAFVFFMSVLLYFCLALIPPPHPSFINFRISAYLIQFIAQA